MLWHTITRCRGARARSSGYTQCAFLCSRLHLENLFKTASSADDGTFVHKNSPSKSGHAPSATRPPPTPGTSTQTGHPREHTPSTTTTPPHHHTTHTPSYHTSTIALTDTPAHTLARTYPYPYPYWSGGARQGLLSSGDWIVAFVDKFNHCGQWTS